MTGKGLYLNIFPILNGISNKVTYIYYFDTRDKFPIPNTMAMFRTINTYPLYTPLAF